VSVTFNCSGVLIPVEDENGVELGVIEQYEGTWRFKAKDGYFVDADELHAIADKLDELNGEGSK